MTKYKAKKQETESLQTSNNHLGQEAKFRSTLWTKPNLLLYGVLLPRADSHQGQPVFAEPWMQ